MGERGGVRAPPARRTARARRGAGRRGTQPLHCQGSHLHHRQSSSKALLCKNARCADTANELLCLLVAAAAADRPTQGMTTSPLLGCYYSSMVRCSCAVHCDGRCWATTEPASLWATALLWNCVCGVLVVRPPRLISAARPAPTGSGAMGIGVRPLSPARPRPACCVTVQALPLLACHTNVACPRRG